METENKHSKLRPGEVALATFKGTMVVVPAVYAQGKDLRGFAPKTVTATVYGYELKLVTIKIRGPHHQARVLEVIARLFGDGGLGAVEVSEVRLGDHIWPLLLPAHGPTVEFVNMQGMQGAERELGLLAQAAYLPLLRVFAKLSGWAIKFHGHGGQAGVPPFPKEPNTLHLIGNTNPPGPSEEQELLTACGYPISVPFQRTVSQGATKGRGVIMLDEHQHRVVQILDSTWYLLVPVFSYFNVYTSVKILAGLLLLGWRGAHQRVVRSQPLGKRAFVKAFVGLRQAPRERYRACIEDSQQRIADFQQALAREMGMLRMWNNAYDRLLTDVIATAKQLGPRDYKRIMEHGAVASITYENEGFHFHTVPMVIEYDGHRYDLGRLTIRMDLDEVSVWTDDPRHPQGIAHPHVDKRGHACLGNATMAIFEAIAADRMGDALMYVLLWLTDGYSPELAALHKLEEWPRLPSEPASEV